MKIRVPLKTLCGCTLLLASLSTRSAGKTGAAPQAAPQSPQRASVCSGQPLCYETSDFAAIITDYRVSDSGGGVKVMDMTVRFQNKTNQPLILGYTQGSAMAIDDQGNRYGLNPWVGTNSLRGIGQVVGNSIDPKFVVQPGGTGDALFELAGRPTTTAGVTFEHDLTIREITALEGHQFALGGEFPLQFKGLANGVIAGAAASQAVPGQALMPGAGSAGAALPVCGPGTTGLGTASTVAKTANSAAGQNISASANSAVASANNTVSQFKSMFGRKKTAAAAPSTTGGTVPCVPANAGASSIAPSNGSGFAVVPAVATTPAVGTTTTTTTTTSAPQTATVSAVGATTSQPRVQTAVSTTTTTTTTKTAAPPAKAPVKKPVTTPPPTTQY